MGKVGVADPEQLAPIALQILDALVAAHSAGIIHRDVKPDNVFLTTARDGLLVKILDFGVSKFLLGEQNRLGETRPGVVVGSPVYMSPEQARGQRDVDGRTDIYSVGVMLFECVTARLPFEADTFNDLLFKIVLEDAPDPRTYRPELEAGFAALIHRAIARDRSARFQTADEFRGALRDWMAQHMGPAAESVGKRAHMATVVRNVVTSSGAVPRANLPLDAGSSPPATAAVAAPASAPASAVAAPLAVASAAVVAPPPPAPVVTASARPRSSALLLALALLGVGAIAIAAALVFRAPAGSGTTHVGETTTSRSPSPPSTAPGDPAVPTAANANGQAALPSPATPPPSPAPVAPAPNTAAATVAMAVGPPKTPVRPGAPKAPVTGQASTTTTTASTTTTTTTTTTAASTTALGSTAPASPASSAAAGAPTPPAAETRTEKIEGRAIRTEL
jgi:serine/threonine-protein kinase